MERAGSRRPTHPLEDRSTKGWRKIVRNFSLSWFTVTMGTGIVSILLYEFPYKARWLYWLSVAIFCLNIALFAVATIISLLRYALWPEMWSLMMHHPNQALFIGAVPMGLAQLVNMTIYICAPVWGSWVIYMAWGLWMTESALSIVIAFYIPFFFFTSRSSTTLESIIAVQLFPTVATVVASGSGAIVATALAQNHPQYALATIITSYVLWGIGIPTAFIIMSIYFYRLMMHKLPPREVIVSVFIPIGPPSLGGFATILLGQTAMEVFPKTKTMHPLAGVILYNMGVIQAIVLWGFGLMWFFWAVAIIYHCKKFPFNIGWWAFTFPIGLFASVSIKLGEVLPSRFFKVIGAVVAVCTFLLWLLVSAGTIRDGISGKLFSVPGIKDLDETDHGRTDPSMKDA